MGQGLRVLAPLTTALIIGVLVATSTASSQATPVVATPCAPASSVVATPPIATPCPTIGDQVDLGTPAAGGDLVVELGVSSDQAGPVTLTVRVTDQSGAPVSGATVVVKARHLDMDMGEFPHDALPIAPGLYAAERVGMGMGGHWRIEVDVTRPGEPPVAVFFLVTMQGLS
ncbi:MAG TPA: FixH family protein [Thermomicrobiales bacterium]|jgi:hypothetical protein